jgi:hypothetical protein
VIIGVKPPRPTSASLYTVVTSNGKKFLNTYPEKKGSFFLSPEKAETTWVINRFTGENSPEMCTLQALGVH